MIECLAFSQWLPNSVELEIEQQLSASNPLNGATDFSPWLFSERVNSCQRESWWRKGKGPLIVREKGGFLWSNVMGNLSYYAENRYFKIETRSTDKTLPVSFNDRSLLNIYIHPKKKKKKYSVNRFLFPFYLSSSIVYRINN